MGVVNITPDSFSDGGNFLEPDAAVRRGLELIEQGADLIDLGAESTRPGAIAGDGNTAQVSAEEEQRRLLPVIEGILKARTEAVISVDTYKASTAKATLSVGAEIVNDVSGFAWDRDMAMVCADAKCGVVLMHTRGLPDEWRGQQKLAADDLMGAVCGGLSQSMQKAIEAGVAGESIVLDPGYGFGKKFDENYVLLARQAELLEIGRPLLAGVSRKSFLGHTLSDLFGGKQAPVEARETASIAALVAAILHGASIVRVHDVRPAVEAARIADAVLLNASTLREA
ncbi:MAG: dihydropteroate synthase [Acidobacteria bacterium]|nr:dihydropteroate synthase [Acidobacteriota bacterium]